MQLKFIFLLMIVGLTQFSCKYNCPGYDLNDRSIISFRLNDTITYVSDANDTIHLVVNNFYADSPSETRGVYTTYECIAQAYYSTNENKNISIKELQVGHIEVYFTKDNPYDLIFQSNKINNDCKVLFFQNKLINSTLYSYVWEVEDLSNRRQIDKFIKVDSMGIIEFHDKTTNKTWIQVLK